MKASTFQTNVAIQVITFLSSVMTARILGVEGRGQLALVLLYPQLIANIASLGVDRAVAVRGGRGELARPMGTLVSLTVLLSLPAMLVGYFIIRHRVVDPHLASLAAGYLASIPATLQFLFLVSFVNGIGDFTRYNRMRLGLYVANFLLICAIWAEVAHLHSKLLSVLLASLVAVYGGLAWAFWQSRGLHAATDQPADQPRLAAIKLVLSLALLYAVPMSLMQVSASAYQIAVEHWLGIKVLGYFVVATAYSRLLAPLGSAIAAHVFRLGISGEKTDIAKVFRFSAIASTACAIPLWLAGPWVIPRVFGGDFAVDHTLIGILMISAMFALLADCLAEYMNGMRLVVPDVMGRLLYLAVLASLSALLVSKIDFLAIAVAMAAGDLARCCFLASRLARKSEFPVIRFIRIEGGEFADFLAVLQRAISKPFIKR